MPFQFDAVSCFYNEVAFIKKEGKYFAINKKGEILNEKGYQRINGFDTNTGLAIVMEEPRKFGAINSKGEETIPVIYNVLTKAPGTGKRTYRVALDLSLIHI